MALPFFRVAQVAFNAFAQAAMARNFFNSLQGLGVNVKTKGGRKLNQFIKKAGDPENYAREAAKALRRQWLPRVRSNSPFLTGRLRAELRITQRGVRVELRGPFYARLVRVATRTNQPATYQYAHCCQPRIAPVAPFILAQRGPQGIRDLI